jgi:hypothetical protein
MVTGIESKSGTSNGVNGVDMRQARPVNTQASQIIVYNGTNLLIVAI